ncbi:MAG TPA: alpha-amylase family glycosyl hydrolase [Chloroflexia bacterium]|nr:alpha-amylase family glycosyl hydrolase [Chloroflexia bacterium]
MSKVSRRARVLGALVLLGLMLQGLPAVLTPGTALADHTPDPTSVTIAGSLQSELGCGGDWDPACAATHLSYESSDDVWQGAFNFLPAGSYEYKAALNNSWDENYGRNAQQNGANISLNLPDATSVKFYYDHKSHWITSNRNAAIAVAPGSFQSEMGCPGDWQPDCLRSWLQDPDENGIYTFETTALPAGNYETKVAHNESWDENYGQNGEPNGANIPFAVPFNNALMTFSYNVTTHILTITGPGHFPDNNVEWDGLGHNSQDLVYRQPFGATNPGTEITLRFRTFHNDVTGVRARVYNTATSNESLLPMQVVASDVTCYDAALASDTCDYWEAAVTPSQLTTLYYRFIVTDGSDVDYYDDDNFKDGGWGQVTDDVRDNSYAITVFDPAFEPVQWMKDAVVYQIFPDRFRNGRPNNDPKGNEPRYGYPTDTLEQIIKKAWSALPEGYCRHYENPPEACGEIPRGRDYFGGDLRGVDQALGYLQAQGITTIYFNPVFDAASNHAYDTQDYYNIDPFFGTQRDWDNLQRHAAERGMHIILDGVFNHVSSDSKYFDRYGHFTTLGACESVDSPYRSWFYFTPQAGGPCVDDNGQANSATYAAWFGFDSLPVLNKNLQEVKDLFYAAPNNVTEYWLDRGASGWRLDVMGDSSFPADFWREFRDVVKENDPEAIIVGELWKKDEMLPKVQGDQADTGMNYRFRNAILGFFGQVDNKGFADDGQYNQPPSLFARKLNSVREDYPDATYYTLMNIMDSHDTQRILWNLSWTGTPDQRNRENREFNAENVAAGKQKLRQAAAVQFTIPGAPTVYYGDEAGVTGDDDPDDRRTFPWLNDLLGGDANPGGDAALRAYYAQLAQIRAANPVLRDGELEFLLTDDANRTMGYGMKTEGNVAIVAVNRHESAAQALTIPLAGYLRDGVSFTDALGGGSATSAGGSLAANLPALGVAIYLMNAGQDITPLAAPVISVSDEGDGEATLGWAAVPGAASYNVYRSPLSGGGYVLAGSTAGDSFTDTGLQNAKTYYYVVTSVDALGNESGWSNEVSALPHYTIGWANLQWPPDMAHMISTVNRTGNIYGQVWIDGVTNQPGPTEGLIAQAGYGPVGSAPDGNPNWTWVDAVFNVDAGNNDEFMASFLPEQVGTFDYVYRYSTTAGSDWFYADLSGPFTGTPSNPGDLTVNSSGDVEAPSTPANLHVVESSAGSVTLGWDPSSDNVAVDRYELLRGDTAGGPYTLIASVGAASTEYVDTDVLTGATYYYVVRAVDTSWNRSGNSNEVAGTANPRQVTVTFNVTVPATTDSTGRTVHIAGSFPPPMPQWDPGANPLTRVDATHWTVTLSLPEGLQLEYKYALGSWDYVEKGASCEELGNRLLTVAYGSNGTQTVNDTVVNWRNVAPCGN